MSVEHSPLTFGAEGTPEKIGVITHHGQPMDVYLEPHELPSDPTKKAICESHLGGGIQDEMLNDFWMGGCKFEKPLEEGVIRVQYGCIGRSGLLKRCRLTLSQFDTDGNKLTDRSS